MRENLRDKRGFIYGSYEKFLNGKTVVYDKFSHRLGEIRPEGNYLVAYNQLGQKLAKWNEKDDYTYDKMNRKIGKGNMLLGMFFE